MRAGRCAPLRLRTALRRSSGFRFASGSTRLRSVRSGRWSLFALASDGMRKGCPVIRDRRRKPASFHPDRWTRIRRPGVHGTNDHSVNPRNSGEEGPEDPRLPCRIAAAGTPATACGDAAGGRAAFSQETPSMHAVFAMAGVSSAAGCGQGDRAMRGFPRFWKRSSKASTASSCSERSSSRESCRSCRCASGGR